MPPLFSRAFAHTPDGFISRVSPVQVRPLLVEASVSHESNAAHHADKAWYNKSQLWDLIAQGPEAFFARHISGTCSAGQMSHGT